MKEEWKKTRIRELDYAISNTGKVKGLGRNRLLKQRPTEDGYLEVTMGSANHGRSSFLVHRLVANLFVVNDDVENKTEVNHKDLNRKNNNYDNLEWMSHLENVQYSINLGSYTWKSGKDNPNYGNKKLKERYADDPELAKFNNSRPASQNGRARKIGLYDLDWNSIKEFTYVGECIEYLIGVHGLKMKADSIRSQIRSSATKHKSYKGFNFKYLD